MAQTTQEIFDEMSAAQATMGTDIADLQPSVDTHQTFLQDLTSQSKVAEHRLVRWVVSRSIRALQIIFDSTVAYLTALVAKSNYGHLRWYQEEAKKFQYGSALTYLDGRYKYDPVIPAQQIVSNCSAIESGGAVILKVAKTVSGVKQPLASGELTAFIEYIRFIRVAGVKVFFINQVPDILTVRAVILYNPLVLAADGTLLSNPSVNPAEKALELYKDSLPFDGRVILSQIFDALQLAEGVANLYFDTVTLEDTVGGTTVDLVLNIEAKAKSGYVTVVPLLSFEPYV